MVCDAGQKMRLFSGVKYVAFCFLIWQYLEVLVLFDNHHNRQNTCHALTWNIKYFGNFLRCALIYSRLCHLIRVARHLKTKHVKLTRLKFIKYWVSLWAIVVVVFEWDWLDTRLLIYIFLSYPVEVDDHGPVAHLGGLMVRVPNSGERHLRAARAHRDPKRRARGVRGRVGVAHHEALPLQNDWFRLVLSADRACREPHGTQQAKRQHTEPVRWTSSLVFTADDVGLFPFLKK